MVGGGTWLVVVLWPTIQDKWFIHTWLSVVIYVIVVPREGHPSTEKTSIYSDLLFEDSFTVKITESLLRLAFLRCYSSAAC